MGFFTLETAQAQVAPGGNFGPWIWELKLKVEEVSADSFRVRLPYSDHVARPGGVLIGQAMMAMADTMMVLSICEKLGLFASLATISQTTNFMRAAVKRDVLGVARVMKIGRCVRRSRIVRRRLRRADRPGDLVVRRAARRRRRL